MKFAYLPRKLFAIPGCVRRPHVQAVNKALQNSKITRFTKNMYLTASVLLSLMRLLSVIAHTSLIHLILQEYSAYNYANPGFTSGTGHFTQVRVSGEGGFNVYPSLCPVVLTTQYTICRPRLLWASISILPVMYTESMMCQLPWLIQCSASCAL